MKTVSVWSGISIGYDVMAVHPLNRGESVKEMQLPQTLPARNPTSPQAAARLSNLVRTGQTVVVHPNSELETARQP